LDIENLSGEGANMASSFLEIAQNKKDVVYTESTKEELNNFFDELKKCGAEFGYRTTYEIGLLMKKLGEFEVAPNDQMDIAIMQKLLPKLHGSRNKLMKTLETLIAFCVTTEVKDVKKELLDTKESFEYIENSKIKYPLSFEKIHRMYKNAIDNGYTSYAEA
jgi:5-methylcytosine-specific restriction enzyme B